MYTTPSCEAAATQGSVAWKAIPFILVGEDTLAIMLLNNWWSCISTYYLVGSGVLQKHIVRKYQLMLCLYLFCLGRGRINVEQMIDISVVNLIYLIVRQIILNVEYLLTVTDYPTHLTAGMKEVGACQLKECLLEAVLSGIGKGRVVIPIASFRSEGFSMLP